MQSLVQTEQGWRDYYDPYKAQPDRPDSHERIWIWRMNWASPQLVKPSDIHPMTNMIGLLWKPAA